MAYVDDVISEVRAWDDARARSQQTEVGWSGLHHCRAWMGFTIAQEWATDDTDSWRACVGTWNHEDLQAIREKSAPRDQIIAFELPVEYGGIPGHVDEINFTLGEITDYKFPSLKSARLWKDPEVQEERFTQPQGYAAAIVGTDRWRNLAPDPDSATVRILICPVDGTFADWFTIERPFDRSVADGALARYHEVQEMQAAGVPLPKDMPIHFCERFCEFYTACRGGDKEPVSLPPIGDPFLAAAIEKYGKASDAIHAGYKVRDELRPILEGLRGRARGYKVFMGKPRGRGKWEIDEDAVRELLTERGLEMPMRQANGKKPSLYVIKEK